MHLEVGSTLGVYEVLSAIGAGGMGEVYKARDTKLDRDVALKILPDAFVNDPEWLARFQREAKVLASLNHPNIAGNSRRVARSAHQLTTLPGGNMIIGAHSVIYSTDPEADRAFLRDVIGLPNVDVGDGWLIFGLPPAEVAVHPSEKNGQHEFYLMCDDIGAFTETMTARGVACSSVQDLGWGRLVQVMLPGGGHLGIYQPRHARPESMTAGGPPKV